MTDIKDRMKEDPASHAHYVRVIVREARSRRYSPSFHATLMEWAANGRRRYMAAKAEQARRALPAQLDLFAIDT